MNLAKSTLPVKLDLGGGQSPKEGFESVDVWEGARHRVDLFKFPWPFESDSVDDLWCSHFIEHIPLRDVEVRDLAKNSGQDPIELEHEGVFYKTRPPIDQSFLGQNMLFAFFDECWRILKKDGHLTCIWPALKSERAFQDPTHCRFIPTATMAYVLKQWRQGNRLDHYRVKCDFTSNVNSTVAEEMNLLHPEAQARRFNESWNAVYDYHAVLTPVK